MHANTYKGTGSVAGNRTLEDVVCLLILFILEVHASSNLNLVGNIVPFPLANALDRERCPLGEEVTTTKQLHHWKSDTAIQHAPGIEVARVMLQQFIKNRGKFCCFLGVDLFCDRDHVLENRAEDLCFVGTNRREITDHLHCSLFKLLLFLGLSDECREIAQAH